MDDRIKNDLEVAQCWNTNAATWTEHVRAGYDTFRTLYNTPAFLELVGDVQGLRILDMGCGEGYNTRLFAERGASMGGIDISEAMIRAARVTENQTPLGIDYHIGSFSDRHPFPDASFDAVVSTLALMDCTDYAGAIREAWRLLRPGGFLAFSLLHPCFTTNFITWDTDETKQESILRFGDYFNERAETERWKFSNAPEDDPSEPFTVIFFHRTLQSIINPLCAAGFCIEKILEPCPTEEACRIAPRLLKHRLLPHTLMVKAIKHHP